MLKKIPLYLAIFAFFSCSCLAYFPGENTPVLRNAAMLLLGIETVLVVLISANLVKFLTITKKNKLVKFIYFTIILFMFNTVLNLLYFVSTVLDWKANYTYIYLIERLIMIIAFVIVTVGFLKFNQLLRVKIR